MRAVKAFIIVIVFFAKFFRQTYSSFSFISYPEITKLALDGKFCSVRITRLRNHCPRVQQQNGEQFYGLVRMDGVEVGHVREINIVPGVTHKLKTVAMKPLMFEIEDFLSAEQCDRIIELAKKSKMFSSTTMAEIPKVKETIGYPFDAMDLDKDGVITAPEFRRLARESHRLYLNDNELLKMFADLNITAFDHDSCYDTNDQCKDWASEGECQKNPSYMLYQCRKSCTNCDCSDEFGNCSSLALAHQCFKDNAEWMLQNCPDSCNVCRRGFAKENFHTLDTIALKEYLKRMKMEDPIHRPRFSNQTWLYKKNDSLLNDIFEREVKLTGLSRDLLEGAEAFQVVQYTKHGHYHAHYDSFGTDGDPQNITCCHQVNNETASCRLCRLLTILYYLNDVPGGGETAFPFANNETLNMTAFGEIKKIDKYNLSKFCHHANLVVKPKRGTAIVWYNHFLDDESTWLGPLDPYSLHGGCDIEEGEKWIINHWITAPYEHSTHIESIYDNRFMPDWVKKSLNVKK